MIELRSNSFNQLETLSTMLGQRSAPVFWEYKFVHGDV